MADESGFEMVPVSSSQIESVGFNPETSQGKVRFLKNGSAYLYEACTQEEADTIINAPSVGQMFASLWKGTKSFQRVS
jgi:hypothetical protein